MTDHYVGQRVRILRPPWNDRIWGETGTVTEYEPNREGKGDLTVVLDRLVPGEEGRFVPPNAPPDYNRTYFPAPAEVEPLVTTAAHEEWNRD